MGHINARVKITQNKQYVEENTFRKNGIQTEETERAFFSSYPYIGTLTYVSPGGAAGK